MRMPLCMRRRSGSAAKHPSLHTKLLSQRYTILLLLDCYLLPSLLAVRSCIHIKHRHAWQIPLGLHLAILLFPGIELKDVR